jgi:hypothetical protein
MAQHDDALPLSEMLNTIGSDGLKDLLRDVVRDALQELIEEELTSTIGAAKHERTETRTAQRKGSFFPELLKARRRVDRALWAVIMTAYMSPSATPVLGRSASCSLGVPPLRHADSRTTRTSSTHRVRLAPPAGTAR